MLKRGMNNLRKDNFFIGDQLCEFIYKQGEVKFKIIEQNVWFVYIDECSDTIKQKMCFGETWEGSEEQIIGLYATEQEANIGMKNFERQADRMCE